MFVSQQLSYKYALTAFFLFGLQGIVAVGGALELIFPDLTMPISYTSGRAFHLNISLYWPLLGMFAAIYFFFSRESGQEMYSRQLINVNYWLLVGTVVLVLGTLLLGYQEGREYLEALWPFKVATAISTILLSYNLMRTFWTAPVVKIRATLVSMLTGSLTLILFYVPNLFVYQHPTTDEIAKFLVVHLWEEMSLELIGIGVLAALLIEIGAVKRHLIETAVYLDVIFIAFAGILATGHHYYWIGVPAYWLWIGGIFSAMQVLPATVLLYSTLKNVSVKRFSELSNRDKITMGLIGSSTFYHIFGAGLLGFFMAYPPINRYVHGTYITSAHAHLALFGVFGFLVLALCFYILFYETVLNEKSYRWCWYAIGALNSGLMIMAGGLLLAGGLQCYFWRIIGLSIGETNELIRPYLALRAAGGGLYAMGSLGLTFLVIKSIWPNIRYFFYSTVPLPARQADLVRIRDLMMLFIEKAKIMEQVLRKILERLKKDR